jgi:hypothetical protein
LPLLARSLQRRCLIRIQNERRKERDHLHERVRLDIYKPHQPESAKFDRKIEESNIESRERERERRKRPLTLINGMYIAQPPANHVPVPVAEDVLRQLPVEARVC